MDRGGEFCYAGWVAGLFGDVARISGRIGQQGGVTFWQVFRLS